MGTEKPSIVRGRRAEQLGAVRDIVADQRLVGIQPGDPLARAVFEGGVAGPGEVVVPVALDNGGAHGPGP